MFKLGLLAFLFLSPFSAQSEVGLTLDADFAYEVDTWGTNDEVYEFTPVHDKSKFCIVYIIDSNQSLNMQCLPKASPPIAPAGKLGKQKLDDYYELDTWGDDTEVFVFTPKSNPAYFCSVISLANGVSADMNCERR